MTGNEITGILNPRLTHFLHNNLGWKNLNEIQEKTIQPILNNENSLIIAPTASGKTEAALIPIYNQIITKHLSRTSVIYIAPLKALINDMKQRVDYWNNYFNLSATKWHGDVSKSVKDKYLREPTDFLLITPESLEVILMNKNETQKEKIFGNVKYVIIDEIHYFIESERGIQLNSLLTRISKYYGNPVKIGLSATLGNPEEVAKWMDLENPTKIIKTTNTRNLKFKLISYENSSKIPEELEKYISKKILIFCNSRKEVEKYYNILKRKLKIDNIFLHHASINKHLKQENERLFKEAQSGIMISTSTLELGIDIGNIDIVVQIGSCFSMSSLLQRIGRGGRRSNIQRAIIFIKDLKDAVLSLSQVNLAYDNKVENIYLRKKAKDIYFHQILSMIFEKGDIKIPETYYTLNKSHVFSQISKDEYREILKHLQDKDMISVSGGHMSLGYEFEKEFGNINFLNFYSVFSTKIEYTIKNGKEDIGELDPLFALLLDVGDTFILGGKYWTITKFDVDGYIIYVKKGGKINNIPKWISNDLMINYLISQEIYNILLGNKIDNILLLDEKYQNKILAYNQTFSNLELDEKTVAITEEIFPDEREISIFTFAGNKVNFLLANIIKQNYEVDNFNITALEISFNTSKVSSNDITHFYNNLHDNIEEEMELYIEEVIKDVVNSKYIEYLPEKVQDEVKIELLFNFDDLKDLLNHTIAKCVSYLNLSELNF